MADDGVMRRSEQDRRAEVVAWRASGKSLGEFARQRGYSRSALEKWARSEASEAAPGFVRLEVARPASTLTLEVADVRIRVEPGFDAQLLGEVVAALRGRTP